MADDLESVPAGDLLLETFDLKVGPELDDVAGVHVDQVIVVLLLFGALEASRPVAEHVSFQDALLLEQPRGSGTRSRWRCRDRSS